MPSDGEVADVQDLISTSSSPPNQHDHKQIRVQTAMADMHIHAPLCIAAGAIFPPVCAGLVALRFYARRQQGSGLKLDDYLTIPALVMLIGMCAATLNGVAKHSVGYPTPPKPPGHNALTVTSYEQRVTRSTLWAIELMQIPALAAVKMSFVFFYRRIFITGHSNVFPWISLAVISATALWGLGYFFSFLFLCPGHPSAYWSALVDIKENCLDTMKLHNAYGISDVILDIVIILLPIPWIWSLKMTNLHKFAIMGVFSLGAFTCVASIIRMITYLQSTAAEFTKNSDTDILITGGIYWSVVESGVGLISCCLPTVYGVFRSRVLGSAASDHRTYPSRISRRTATTGTQSTFGAIKNPKEKRWNDTSSQTSEIELTGPVPMTGPAHTTKAEGPNEEASWGARPQDHILITKTFGAEKQSPDGDMV